METPFGACSQRSFRLAVVVWSVRDMIDVGWIQVEEGVHEAMSKLINQKTRRAGQRTNKQSKPSIRKAIRDDRAAIRALQGAGPSRRKRGVRNIQPKCVGLKGRRQAGRGGVNSAYNSARYGAGMRTVTDGISIMKTIHNGSVIEDTFSIRREKISNIVGSTGSTLSLKSQLYLNPGNTVLFPIFSQIAATYEQYRVNTLVFSYETEAYAASGSAVSAGKVILATNFDPADANFSTDTQMENYYNSDRGAPYCEIVHDVLMGDHALKDEPLKDYFVNSSANLIAPTSDSTANKFYDLGNFQLGTQGTVDATSEIGELYVTYSFTMIRPKQQTPLGQNFLSSHYVGSIQTTANAFVGTTQRAGSNINMTVAASVITFNSLGRYSVTYLANATSTTTGTTVASAGAAFVAILNVGNPTVVAGNATSLYSQTYYVDVTAVGGLVTMANTVVNGTTWDLVVSQVPSGLLLSKSEKVDNDLVARLNRLELLLQHSNRLPHNIDSDFDDEEKISSHHLSQSTLDVIGEIISRKTNNTPR
jgi:hypothetical protein